jgi:hypothetical protein
MLKRRRLREIALWYPSIPEPHLCLNDDYFMGTDPFFDQYRPLCWSLFGGPGGIYLRFLTGITVTRFGDVRCIEFHYNTDEVPAGWGKLGRYQSTGHAKVLRFPIDGPGGERIKTFEVGLSKEHKYDLYNTSRKGELRAIKASWVNVESLQIWQDVTR